nr:restriction endonuclease subunit S [uncultured Shimia sp.]
MRANHKIKLSEIAKVISGFAFKSSEFGDEGVPVLKIANIRMGSVDTASCQRVSAARLEALPDKYRVHPGDILISLTGSHVTQPNSVVGRVARMSATDATFLLNQRAGKVIVQDLARVDPNFLYFALMGCASKGEIASMASGAASQANVSPTQVGTLQVFAPPLPTQQRIATILSAYDDLIENNTRRIAILEEMARRLYEEWFVHFRFRGHEAVEFDGELPSGWATSTVKDAVQRFTTGQKYDQKTVISSGAIPVLDQGKVGIIGYHNDAPGFPASIDDPVVVFANHTCYQRLVMFPFSTIQNVIPFKSSPDLMRDIYWLHHVTFGLVELNDYKGHWPQFAAKVIAIPPTILAEKFGSRVAPMHQQVRLLQQKTANLRAQRDLLLPKLISGEIDVSEAEEAMEAAE